MIKIKDIKAREILDSRGNPTVEVELFTDASRAKRSEAWKKRQSLFAHIGSFLALVPSGASVGKYEAKELRDGGGRYKGKGVLKAIKNIEEIIAPRLIDTEIKSQKQADEILISLDGTKDKSNLGANAILPELTDLENIFTVIQGKVNFVMAESLNMKCGNWEDIQSLLERKYPRLLVLYRSKFDQRYWQQIERELKELSSKFGIPLKGFYRH